MTATPAPTCRAALREATALYPERSTASDGLLPSAAHHAQNPDSDHETGDAFDLTDDPAHGCKAHGMVAELVVRRDPRVKYIISAGYIWRSYDRPATAMRPFLPAWHAERYTGSNPHTKHAHVSIFDSARNDLRPWWTTTAAPPAPVPLETFMSLFSNDDEAAAFLVVLAYSTLLGRAVESLQVLAWWMQAVKDHDPAYVWDAITKSDEAIARAAAVAA